MRSRITVVGAGVIGLSCAVRLAEAGHAVDVISHDLPLQTTSAVAGGLWLPFLAAPPQAVARWSRLTLTALLDLAAEPADGPAGPHGVILREGYLLGVGRARPDWAHDLPEISLREVENPAAHHEYGWHLRVPLVDMHVHLTYLSRRLARAGGTLTQSTLTELPHGVVVNSSGLAARSLIGDLSVTPVRGQVVWLTNPGLRSWWMDESDPQSPVYAIPHPRHVVIGGTAEAGNWSTTPDPATAKKIIERVVDLVPELRDATVISHRAGLRPARPAIRLETVRGPHGTVIHCYGHGGSGVTTAWGCADDVLSAVNQAN